MFEYVQKIVPRIIISSSLRLKFVKISPGYHFLFSLLFSLFSAILHRDRDLEYFRNIGNSLSRGGIVRKGEIWEKFEKIDSKDGGERVIRRPTSRRWWIHVYIFRLRFFFREIGKVRVDHELSNGEFNEGTGNESLFPFSLQNQTASSVYSF